MDSTVGHAPPSLHELRQQRETILQLAHRHGARDIRVFGSVARGDAADGSDVDFLVTMESGRSLFDLGGLLMDLRDLLGSPVDVVTPTSLGARVRARVLREAVPL
ncbi:MAG TPA: nucleotidyltransferase family protein [Pseudonocardia sp.]